MYRIIAKKDISICLRMEVTMETNEVVAKSPERQQDILHCSSFQSHWNYDSPFNYYPFQLILQLSPEMWTF